MSKKSSAVRIPMGFIVARENVQLLVWTVVLYLAFAIPYASKFATTANTSNISQQAAVLLVVALGQMLALLIGGFDISVGANMGFVSVVAALMMQWQAGTAIAAVIGLGTGALIGLVNGTMIAVLGVNPFAATLGMLTFLLGIGNVLSEGASVPGVEVSFGYLGRLNWGPLPSSVAIAGIALVLTWIVLRESRLGLYLYGLGGSRNASLLAGVAVVRYEILGYTICGLLAGLAGLMLTARVSIGQAELGSGYELLSIAAAVIGGTAIGGGTASLLGVVLGSTLIQVLATGLAIAGVGPYRQQMATGAVIVIAAGVAKIRGVKLADIIPGLAATRIRHRS